MRSKPTVLLVLLLFLSSTSALASKDSLGYPQHTVFIELGGYGGFWSLNYDRVLWRKGIVSITGRIGFGLPGIVFDNELNPSVAVPIGVNLLLGKKGMYFEFGLAQIPASIVRSSSKPDVPERVAGISAGLSVGMRWHKPQGGFFLSAHYTLLSQYYKDLQHWAGIGIGYTFKYKNESTRASPPGNSSF